MTQCLIAALVPSRVRTGLAARLATVVAVTAEDPLQFR